MIAHFVLSNSLRGSKSFLVMLDLVGQQALHSISEDVLADSEVERTIGWVGVYGPMEKVKAWHLHLIL